MLAIFALLVQDYILREPRTSTVAAYGAFRLEREDCIEHPEIAVLHYPHCFPKARLIWSSADGKISARYEDNGYLLTVGYDYPIRAKAPEPCSDRLSLAAYGLWPAGAGSWRAGTRTFVAALTRCSTFDPAQIAAYKAEFEAAAPHYKQAAAGLRSLATTMFKTLRRCTSQQAWPRHGGADAVITCTREEGPDA